MAIFRTTGPTGTADADLVTQSLAGDRDAFGQIVARYQSLIYCSLAYSATGSLGQSQDLAQETFITAWKRLGHLNERHKLRAWLCGIARFLIGKALRREGREPVHAAEPLEALADSPAADLPPSEHVISQEEAAILWRSIERIPEIYREPLVLFYREHRSVEHVAAALDISEETVRQRLSRGRKLLHVQVRAFVETALERTNPGKAFTLGVVAALPAFAVSAKAAAVGVTAAKGGTIAKTAAAAGLFTALILPAICYLGNFIGYQISMAGAESDYERDYVRSFHKRLTYCILGYFVAYGLLMWWAWDIIRERDLVYTSLILGLVLPFTAVAFARGVWIWSTRRRFKAGLAARGLSVEGRAPAWEYRSRMTLFGLPLVHIRISGGLAVSDRPVKAWIAVGDRAIGVLVAYGGLAIAPFSLGGLAIGLVPWGGCAIGVLALGGISLGVWSFGALAVGWQCFGACAVAWNLASGGVAVAHDYALGGIAIAAQANNEAAHLMRKGLFFQYAPFGLRHLIELNLFWVFLMFIWWRIVARHRRIRDQASHRV